VWTDRRTRLILAAMAKGRDRAHSARLTLAINMKRLRIAKGLSQERLAALARLHPNYVGSVERRERNISIDNLEKIAMALGVSLPALFEQQPKGG
jgi:transcriptional regulator with XRE-family HTH domain